MSSMDAPQFEKCLTWAIPVTEMATPWAEYTLLLVTWSVMVFKRNLKYN